MKSSVLLLGLMLLTGCTLAPRGVTAVASFDLERYLGRSPNCSALPPTA